MPPILKKKRSLSKTKNLPEKSKFQSAAVKSDVQPQKFIVGVGASAGGLEALRALFGSLKVPKNMAFIVVQHLAPLFKSRLVELIAHSTQLTVKEAEDGMRPEMGCVYITPPNKDVFIEQGVLRLDVPRFAIGPKPSIDLFFRSLAEDSGENSIGIILSGTGSDGAHGIRAIKASGGVTFSQKAESAKYDGMPKAAKLTGSIDFELTPEKIAAELSRYDEQGAPVSPADDDEDEDGGTLSRLRKTDPYKTILSIVHEQVGANFGDYKQSTIRRRIERRIVATHCNTLSDYTAYLAKTSGEAQLLFQDILISVTSFFRDANAFKVLSAKLYEKLRVKPEKGTFRCWIAGCATGEEAYSIAILISEALDRLEKKVNVQIFATDLDENALQIARKGLYSAGSFREFPKNLRDKYFIPKDDCFQVKAPIREAVVFAKHNLVEDPPFLNMDLVTCRNVLIYFNSVLQERIFKTFHYSLDRSGILFLGKSESVSEKHPLFEIMDKTHRLFKRVDGKGALPKEFKRAVGIRDPERAIKLKEPDEGTELFNSMLTALAPDSVLVDEEFKIEHVYGEAGRHLTIRPGQATQSLVHLVSSELGGELGSLLYRTKKTGQPTTGRRYESVRDKKIHSIQLSIVPLTTHRKVQYLVLFLSSSNPLPKLPKKDSKASSSRTAALEEELAKVQGRLQLIIEEQETNNEELQSLNEELQSANEELQSASEELETSNEELQSSNEELTTVNEELNVKSIELQALNQRSQAIQNAIIYPLLVLDRNKQLINFNPAARFLLRINDTDVGSHIKAIPSYIDLDPVIKLIDHAITTGSDQTLQFKTRERSFEVQIQLYRGIKETVEGAVVSFVENSEISNSLADSRFNRERLSNILENTPAMVTMKDLTGVYVYANRYFCELIRLTPEEVIGRSDEELFGGHIAPEIREHDYDVIKHRKPQNFEETFQVAGVDRVWASSKFPILDAHGRVQSVCAISVDITERVQQEQQLKLFKQAISESNTGVMIFEGRVENLKATFVSEILSHALEVPNRVLVGQTLPQFLASLKLKSQTHDIVQMCRQLAENRSTNFVINLESFENQEAWIELRGSRLNSPREGEIHLILSFFDVTQRIQNERTIAAQQEDLTRYSRFSALGEIAAGIGHEINTPLNVISTKADLLRKLADRNQLDPARAVKVAEDVSNMVKNISSVVMGLKSVAGIDPEKFERIDLKKLIRDTVKICEHRLSRSGIALQMELPATDLRIDCYPVQISQIIINLLNNALDAIATLPVRWIRLSVNEDDSHVFIRVTDSGNGIDLALAEKIMTPFFTTKRETKGTGIGLSLSRTIARNHGGELTLDASVSHTCFKLELPKDLSSLKERLSNHVKTEQA